MLGLTIGMVYFSLINLYFNKIKVNSKYEYVEYIESDIDPVDKTAISWTEEKIVYENKSVQFINSLIEQDLAIKLIFSLLMYSLLEYTYLNKQPKDKAIRSKNTYGSFFIGFSLSAFPSILLLYFFN